MNSYQKYIRNFSIIAHIDHGKSTLADRIIEKTGLVSEREMKEQFLDNMDLERERGITIKLQTTRLVYKAKDGQEYILNLIDTPGHVDFTYEVSRSLAACEGAVLVVDATQGVEAQTLANVYLALDEDLEILPVLNKIDLPSARPDEIKAEVEDMIGIDAAEAPMVSAKEGIGIEDLLEEIVHKIPAPSGDEGAKLKALIFDSYYDNYKGVVIYTRVFDGSVKPGDMIRLMNTGKKYEVTEVGIYSPGHVPCRSLRAGEVGDVYKRQGRCSVDLCCDFYYTFCEGLAILYRVHTGAFYSGISGSQPVRRIFQFSWSGLCHSCSRNNHCVRVCPAYCKEHSESEIKKYDRRDRTGNQYDSGHGAGACISF